MGEKHVKVQMPTIKDLARYFEEHGEKEFAEKMRTAEKTYMERRKECRKFQISEQIIFENMRELDEFLKLSTEEQYEFLQKKREMYQEA